VIALIGSGTPSTHPKALAIYSTRNVTKAIIPSEQPNATQPYFQCGGGTKAKSSSHPIVIKWIIPALNEKSSISPSSFLVGCNMHALINC